MHLFTFTPDRFPILSSVVVPESFIFKELCMEMLSVVVYQLVLCLLPDEGV